MSVHETRDSSFFPSSSSRRERSGNCISRAVSVIGDNPKSSAGISITAFVVVLLLAISATGGCGVIGHLTGSSLLQALTNTLSLTSFIAITGGSGGAAVFLSFLSLIVFLCKRGSTPTTILPKSGNSEALGKEKGTLEVDREAIKSNIIPIFECDRPPMPPNGCYAIYQIGQRFRPVYQNYSVFYYDSYYSSADSAIDSVLDSPVSGNLQQWTPDPDAYVSWFNGKFIQLEDPSMLAASSQPPDGEWAIYQFMQPNSDGKYLVYHSGHESCGYMDLRSIYCSTAQEAIAQLSRLNGGKEPWTPKTLPKKEANSAYSRSDLDDGDEFWASSSHSKTRKFEGVKTKEIASKIVVVKREDNKLFAKVPKGQFAIFQFKKYEDNSKAFALKYNPKKGLEKQPDFFKTKDEAVKAALEEYSDCVQWIPKEHQQ